METITLETLKEYCKDNNRICPVPKSWNQMWKKLLMRKGVGTPPAPLILAAWWEAPGILKQLRLMEQLEWADRNGMLPIISRYLHTLTEDQWHHLGDS